MIDAAALAQDEAGLDPDQRGPRAAGGRGRSGRRRSRAGTWRRRPGRDRSTSRCRATSRLWDLPNVIITPHVGGQSRLRIDQMTDFFCDNLRRYLAGQAASESGRQAIGLSACAASAEPTQSTALATRRTSPAKRRLRRELWMAIARCAKIRVCDSTRSIRQDRRSGLDASRRAGLRWCATDLIDRRNHRT